MQKGAAIFMLLLFGFTQTECGQLLKLPLLVSHFIKHQQKGSSFMGFLAEHYSVDEHHDQDREEDNQLPFKSTLSEASVAFVLPSTTMPALPQLPVSDQKILLKNQRLPQHLHSIFHPPRIA